MRIENSIHSMESGHRKRIKYGSGGVISKVTSAVGTVLNKAIDILPFEAHIPGYRFCGPGTRLEERLARGDPPIDKLDAACKAHDISYYQFKDTKNRAIADKVLSERAWERFIANDSDLKEKAAAWAITNTMKIKLKLGGGNRKRKTKRRVSKKSGEGMYLRQFKKTGGGVRKKRSKKKQKY